MNLKIGSKIIVIKYKIEDEYKTADTMIGNSKIKDIMKNKTPILIHDIHYGNTYPIQCKKYNNGEYIYSNKNALELTEEEVELTKITNWKILIKGD